MKNIKNSAIKICIYGITAALCIVLGYVEGLLPLDFIAPGIKLGLANSVTLIFAVRGDIKGAFAVNIVRILLSALLFSSPSVLIYSLSAGIVSLLSVALLLRTPFFGIIGLSVSGAIAHNLTQLLCAALLLGTGVLYYTPFLLLTSVISGGLTGITAKKALTKIRF